jgi:hypothetical protein
MCKSLFDYPYLNKTYDAGVNRKGYESGTIAILDKHDMQGQKDIRK